MVNIIDNPLLNETSTISIRENIIIISKVSKIIII